MTKNALLKKRNKGISPKNILKAVLCETYKGNKATGTGKCWRRRWLYIQRRGPKLEHRNLSWGLESIDI
jgi:hypothetical protein